MLVYYYLYNWVRLFFEFLLWGSCVYNEIKKFSKMFGVFRIVLIFFRVEGRRGLSIRSFYIVGVLYLLLGI